MTMMNTDSSPALHSVFNPDVNRFIARIKELYEVNHFHINDGDWLTPGSLEEIANSLGKLSTEQDAVLDFLTMMKTLPDTVFQPIILTQILPYASKLIAAVREKDNLYALHKGMADRGHTKSHFSLSGFNVSLDSIDGTIQLAQPEIREAVLGLMDELRKRKLPHHTHGEHRENHQKRGLFNLPEEVKRFLPEKETIFAALEELKAVGCSPPQSVEWWEPVQRVEELLYLAEHRERIIPFIRELKTLGFHVDYLFVPQGIQEADKLAQEGETVLGFLKRFEAAGGILPKGDDGFQLQLFNKYPLTQYLHDHTARTLALAKQGKELCAVVNAFSQLGISLYFNQLFNRNEATAKLVEHHEALAALCEGVRPHVFTDDVKDNCDWYTGNFVMDHLGSLIRLTQFRSGVHTFVEALAKDGYYLRASSLIHFANDVEPFFGRYYYGSEKARKEMEAAIKEIAPAISSRQRDATLFLPKSATHYYTSHELRVALRNAA